MLFHLLFFGILLHIANSSVFVTDNDEKRVLEIRDGSCVVHADDVTVSNMLKSSEKYVEKISTREFDDLNRSCSDVSQITKSGRFIYPGTRWCGPGNIASSFSDLGLLTEEDKCCRDHDHCPNQLEPGQCRRGICNISPFTSSHCDCDTAFKRCLRETNSPSANVIGSIYFNVVQVTCFKDRRLCPQYMRENLSYNWFCEEWRFDPTPAFEPSLLAHKEEKSQPTTHPVPDMPANVKTEPAPPSSIEKNLKNLFEQSPNVAEVMKGSNIVHELKESDAKSPSISVLNSISNGKMIFRD